jgi:hypothetical protein
MGEEGVWGELRSRKRQPSHQLRPWLFWLWVDWAKRGLCSRHRSCSSNKSKLFMNSYPILKELYVTIRWRVCACSLHSSCNSFVGLNIFRIEIWIVWGKESILSYMLFRAGWVLTHRYMFMDIWGVTYRFVL